MMLHHKQNVEDLIQAVGAARGRLLCLLAMPMHRDAGLVQMIQQQAALSQGTLQQRTKEGRKEKETPIDDVSLVAIRSTVQGFN